jgi:ABC-type uncharacterized transport system substrate-binding protein
VAAIGAVWLLLHAGGVAAHPHLYVDYAVTLPVGPQSIDDVGFAFTFDVPYSAMVRYATQAAGAEGAAERHAGVLRQLPYEIEINYNGAPVALEEPTDLKVTDSGGKLTYEFRVRLPTPLAPPGTIDISVVDHGMYAAFAPRPFTPVEVKASGAATATCERAQPPNLATGQIRCRYGAPPP